MLILRMLHAVTLCNRIPYSITLDNMQKDAFGLVEYLSSTPLVLLY